MRVSIERSEASLPILAGLLQSIVRRGHLTVIDWRGRKSSFGDLSSRLRATVRLHDRLLPWKIALGAGCQETPPRDSGMAI